MESKTPVQSNKRSVSLDNIVDAILKHPDLLSVKAKSLNTFLRKLDDYEVNKFAKKRATLVKKYVCILCMNPKIYTHAKIKKATVSFV